MRYALSSDEFLLELRDKSAPNRIRRLCQTLNKQCDVPESELMFLKDFISIKLAKMERGTSWTTLGYDIAGFTVPERGQMKSNFLKTIKKAEPEVEAPVVEQPEVIETEASTPVPSEPAVEEIELTEEEKEAKKEAEIEALIQRQQITNQTYLNLDTDAIYSIH